MPKKSPNVITKLIDAAERLSRSVDRIEFQLPVTHVYNPLQYAWESHRRYLQLASDSPSVIFLGMNPGPWGMAQTGVPFGEIAAVRDWLGIHESIGKPAKEHPKRPIEGFDCSKSEVSGRRLWGLFAERFEEPSAFFRDHFVLNYCPLVFMEESARNRTPDKLLAEERRVLDEACDFHLASVLGALTPKHAVGVGVYAEKCLKRVRDQQSFDIQIHRILHPSPASPAANKDWSSKVTVQLKEAGVWTS
ncbi:MAG: uracil-DNA glycosylase family protein [Planctomycetota bacterium]